MFSPLWFVAAVCLVITARGFSAIAGAALGMVVALVLGYWGYLAYEKGAGIALAGIPLQRPWFLAFALGWFLIESFALWRALRGRSRVS